MDVDASRARRNIRLIIEYDGTLYHGFQTQEDPALPTIQSMLEQAILRICGERVRVSGSGRTDAGAHALGQVVNFPTEAAIPLGKFAAALNSALPRDIRVLTAEEMPGEFHARFDAQAKTYCYLVNNRAGGSVFWRRYAYHVPQLLQREQMRLAGACLVGTHDFASFRTAGSSARGTIRTVYWLEIAARAGLMAFAIKADGFLYNMVRNIVGTLLAVGKGRLAVEEVPIILEARDRTRAGPTVPAHGLYLCAVEYGPPYGVQYGEGRVAAASGRHQHSGHHQQWDPLWLGGLLDGFPPP